ncbi:MAG: MFS transporter [Cyanosarcina radialis HA8281-LM2]|jgi:MFS family permease|nr:MFS transporter [Cyanosarcina radialis HA8281-LM2]
MTSPPSNKPNSWFPQLNPQVWILIFGRFLSQIGTGFTLFYAPIFFVNQVGLSATQVGLAIGSASISGIVGRIASGSMSDSPFWGRKRTLLLSAAVSAIASLVFATTTNFVTLVIGNLLLGLGIGLYWPATEAVVADLAQGEQRQEAYALTRLGDNVGLGLGIILGGLLIGRTGAYRTLFVIDAISFAVFFGVIWVAISETLKSEKHEHQPLQSWKIALRDRLLLIYVLANIFFTTYISQLESTVPLYFTNFVSLPGSGRGFAPETISLLFAWHLIVAICSQIPILKLLGRWSHLRSLTISLIFWTIGFLLVSLTGVADSYQLAWASLAMGVLAIAITTYSPTASSLVADIAPPTLRGIYASINSLCWAVGYAIGPVLGGFALDRDRSLVYFFWVALAASVIVPVIILRFLDRLLRL